MFERRGMANVIDSELREYIMCAAPSARARNSKLKSALVPYLLPYGPRIYIQYTIAACMPCTHESACHSGENTFTADDKSDRKIAHVIMFTM